MADLGQPAVSRTGSQRGRSSNHQGGPGHPTSAPRSNPVVRSSVAL